MLAEQGACAAYEEVGLWGRPPGQEHGGHGGGLPRVAAVLRQTAALGLAAGEPRQALVAELQQDLRQLPRRAVVQRVGVPEHLPQRLLRHLHLAQLDRAHHEVGVDLWPHLVQEVCLGQVGQRLAQQCRRSLGASAALAVKLRLPVGAHARAPPRLSRLAGQQRLLEVEDGLVHRGLVHKQGLLRLHVMDGGHPQMQDGVSAR
mmetsp:Transcript_59120/g.153605  ORF Transcript_59120/g.153605 Transcript_59120/m.153605 type:complete len:203 (+) Transcript_59120:322-930(+)